METMECIKTRRTLRSFSDKEVPDDVVGSILEAGRLSPSAMNLQPWHFIVVKDRERLLDLGNYCMSGRFVFEASFAVIVATDEGNKWHEIDGARAVQNMTLAAWNFGVGTCWIGAIDRKKVKDMFAIPSKLYILTVLPFGYPSESQPAGGKLRRPPEDVFHLERFGNSYK